MPARVLHVIPSVAPRYGGPSTAVIGMCRALSAIGTAALVATTDADGDGRLAVCHGEVVQYQSVPTIFFRRQFSESFKWSAPLAMWLRRHVHEYDLVHVHAVFSHASVAAGRACRRARVPYIVRPLGTIDPWSLRRHPRRKRLLLAFGGRKLLSGATVIHYTTSQEQQQAERSLPWLPRGVVAPLGIEDELFDSAAMPSVSRAQAVLFMARLDPKKGIDVLIDAFHAASGTGSFADWQLVIAGVGDPLYVAELRERASAGAARDRIKFLGWVAGAERRDLLRSARLFALPSLQENFGIALVEAMASGLPVLVTPGVNLATELEAAGAGWISDRTVPGLSSTLRAAMRNPHELDRRSRQARQFAEVFRWPQVAQAVRSMYDDVLGRSASHLSRDFSPAPQA